jgi:zinc and cadmium transporter
MSVFWWILLSTLAMSLISWVGLLVLFFKEDILRKITLGLVAFSAGALIAGAFLHMIPEAMGEFSDIEVVFGWVLLGFSFFFLLEQFIHFHHCHDSHCDHNESLPYLILIADGLHNFIGGLVIATAFIVDIRVGIIIWLVSAAHEIPQELGDFAILIHSGWNKTKALVFNFISASTMVIGGLLVFFLSAKIDVTFLLPFAAGNFIYIAASDLIPEVKHHKTMTKNVTHFIAFVLGLFVIWGIGLIE